MGPRRRSDATMKNSDRPLRRCEHSMPSTITTSAEQHPKRADLRDRLHELISVREALRPDIDDAHVLSEYVSVEQQIDDLKAMLWPSRS